MSKLVPAVCPCCGAGCGLYLESEDGKLVLTAPSRADAVSEGRLCMRGWQVGDMVRSSLHLGTPLVHGSPASWDEALDRTAQLLQPMLNGPQPRLGVLTAGHLTNEEGFAVAHFARDVLDTPNIDNFGRSVDGPTIWGLEQSSGRPYERPPLRDLVNYDLIVCLNSNLGYLNAQACSWVARAQQMGASLAVVDQIDDGLGRLADLYLKHAPGAVTALLHLLAQTLETDCGAEISADLADLGPEQLAHDFARLVEMLNQSSKVAIVLSTRAFSTPHAGMVVGELAARINACKGDVVEVFAVNGTPNSVGLGHMGVVPYLSEQPGNGGLGLFEMLDANLHHLDGLIVIAEELMSWLDRDGMDELRDMLDVVIVVDSFRTATGRIADVTLPMCGYGEREGSFTTLDGKVRWNGKVVDPWRQCRYLPQILAELTQRLGHEPGPHTVDEIWHQINGQIAGYQDISPATLRERNELDVNLQAIPPNQDYSIVEQSEYAPIEVADPEKWQYTLMGRYDAHWWIYDGRMWSLPLLYREMRDWRASHIMMNPDDMEKDELRPGRPVIVETARGRAEVVAHPYPNLQEGSIILPAHQRHLMESLMGPARCDRRSCALVYSRTPARVRRA